MSEDGALLNSYNNLSKSKKKQAGRKNRVCPVNTRQNQNWFQVSFNFKFNRFY